MQKDHTSRLRKQLAGVSRRGRKHHLKRIEEKMWRGRKRSKLLQKEYEVFNSKKRLDWGK